MCALNECELGWWIMADYSDESRTECVNTGSSYDNGRHAVGSRTIPLFLVLSYV